MFTCPSDSLIECNKCMGCNICKNHCPIQFSAKEMIRLYKEERYNDLHNYIYDNHPFPIICGFICPNHFCMEHCPRDIDIKGLRKHFALSFDWKSDKYYPKNGKKIAIIGGGVGGLTCAWYLYKEGYTIDLYEKDCQLGGELNLIPEERLPRNYLNNEIERLSKFIDNLYLDTEFNPEKAKDYDKVFYCIGSHPKTLMSLHGAIDYSTYLSQPYKEENIAIIGGGNVALDCAISNKGHSTIFVRRNLWDMRIDKKDFQLLLDKKITVISNFTPISSHQNVLRGLFHENHFEEKFDKIVIAIGKEDNIIETIPENGFVIKPSRSVVETISTTLEQLKNYIDN